MTGETAPHDSVETIAEKPSDPCAMIIFGASGDLTKRKLVPALYNLAREGLLSEEFAVIGVSRTEVSHEAFREKLGRDMQEFATGEVDPELWQRMVERFYYLSGDVGQTDCYHRLEQLLGEVAEKHETEGNCLTYLATAPRFFSEVVRRMGAAGMLEEDGRWRRVVFEKPFGHDLESARELNREVSEELQEHQIYRIDHYLGKETVQNILMFRLGNGIFEPIWNRGYIDHVQITVAETVGVEDRGGYFEQAGTLRDMVPNHILQLVSLIAMEPPISFAADAVRDEQAKALNAIQPLTPEDVLTCAVRGQYGPGTIDGDKARGYRSEPGVASDSRIETFVALRLTIDNWRWADVPFYIRTGKRLRRRVTEIVIQFKRAPFLLFRKTAVERLMTNRLVIRIQPDEGISLRFGAKVPGAIPRMAPVNMDFQYKDYFGAKPSTGYERLLYDCMCGDATLFQRADMVEAGWSVVSPILDVWQALPPRNFPNYEAGEWGPKEADELVQRDGRYWRLDGSPR